jgi:single-stranded DNA-binding protein
MGLNVINLVGRVGADPQVRYFDSGKVLCELAVVRLICQTGLNLKFGIKQPK